MILAGMDDQQSKRTKNVDRLLHRNNSSNRKHKLQAESLRLLSDDQPRSGNMQLRRNQ